ncbi:MAG TPA: formate--tetrahydrofolate ligase [Dehalococcoidia bacterium]|nr:formate--tetrahydrofolate ligase [Dehalococcoidia bacterium]
MKTNLEIEQGIEKLPITEVVRMLGLDPESINLHGKYIAKLPLSILHERAERPDGKLILVTAVTPTRSGEGKTTVAISLSDALTRLRQKTTLCLREPSGGPYFGMKGGATGGGYAQVTPAEDINLHFTGDMYGVSKANNLLASMIDNHLYFGNPLQIDSRRVTWKRVIDLNDRALRDIIIGLGGTSNGFPRRDGFDITPASEVMTILSLAMDPSDLHDRLKRIVVGYTHQGEPVTCAQLKADSAMVILLRDTIQPNLVQTLGHSPAIIHGGAFANIAHGCNTLFATTMALKLADYVVTEAGFGSDLGAEKFFDIKCRTAGLQPNAAVIVATVRALKHHGDGSLEEGFANLAKHIENIRCFGVSPVVAINRFDADTDDELLAVQRHCEASGVPAAVCDGFNSGGAGAEELARVVMKVAGDGSSSLRFLYPLDLPIKEKMETIATKMYGAAGVEYDRKALASIEQIERLGLGNLPVCVAKTQASLSDRSELKGAPRDFTITVNDVRLSAGAGLVVMLCGSIMTMPGLPRVSAAELMQVDSDGQTITLA